MKPRGCIVDTNVVVSGLIAADPDAPPARILDTMLDGKLVYLMSGDLLDEYSTVLRRPSLVRLHGRKDEQLDRLLAELVANAIWHEPTASGDGPDPQDGATRGRCLPAIRRACSSRVTGFSSRTLRAEPP